MAARRRRGSLRQPPRPPYENHKGRCALCGEPPTGRRRTWCSDDCVRLWHVATRSESALHHLADLHGWRCWACDATWQPGTLDNPLGYVLRSWEWDGLAPDLHAPRVGRAHAGPYCHRPLLGPPEPRQVVLEVEHVRPLWSLTEEERTRLRWWLPFNLQLLCEACHRAKSRREAAARAAFRRTGVLVLEPDTGPRSDVYEQHGLDLGPARADRPATRAVS